jgi:hypothetical protein
MHDDRTRVEPLAINTIIIGNKYEKFEKFEAENRKWVVRALRF